MTTLCIRTTKEELPNPNVNKIVRDTEGGRPWSASSSTKGRSPPAITRSRRSSPGSRTRAEVTSLADRAPRKITRTGPGFDARSHLHRLTGVDLTRIDGIDAHTARKVVSEIGLT